MNLYLTADRIGIETGGGAVTAHEYKALSGMGDCLAISIDHARPLLDPFAQDQEICERVQQAVTENHGPPRIVHCYAGCLTETVAYLKSLGAVVTYTAAAHDVSVSKHEHEKMGLAFPYPHLTDHHLWQRYLGGYLQADVLVCPSQHSVEVMRRYGRENRIEIIPHGVEIPETIAPLPRQFTVGYLGTCGAPDKGLVYLLQAWKALAYKDAVLLLAGRDSVSPYVRGLITAHGGGNIQLLGWVQTPSDFYNRLSLYIQPSCSEGFGLEVLEAMAHGRPVLCSKGAGACDLLPEHHCFAPADPDDLARLVDHYKNSDQDWLATIGSVNRRQARDYTWTKIRQKYQELWRNLL